MTSAPSRRCLSDEAGLVVGWLVRILIGIAITGLLLVEVGGVLFARYKAAETASGASAEAAFVIRTRGLQSDFEEAARQFVAERDGELVSVVNDPQNQQVMVTVRRQATTMIVQRIGALEEYATATSSDSASYAS